MPDIPIPLDLRSHDLAADKRDELLRLFPEIRTEGGQVDFERLKLALGEVVYTGRERYGLTWPGKAHCFRAIQTPSMGTLRPAPEESVNFDTTENLIIEGDNLEVLKLLQKSYLGKVKMIYIDPPYNTGNDFIYPDNFSESLQTYLQYTGQVDAEGKKFSTNTDTDGRFHSRWLNMMYPRLYLARNLLREDGVIFITIDDSEHPNLRHVCNDIFGEDNFIASVVWQKKQSPQRDATYFSDMHDHVLVYARHARRDPTDTGGWVINPLKRGPAQTKRYKNPDQDPRGDWASVDCTINKSADERPNLFYPIVNPTTGKEVWPTRSRTWAFEKSKMDELLSDGRIWWGAHGRNFPRVKAFLTEVQAGVVPGTVWLRGEYGDNQAAAREIRELFSDTYGVFDTPKPVRLITGMLALSTSGVATESEIVLDFFAGSGTTAHAVLDLNKQDGGNRKFILVQLPEPTERADYPTIAEITKERVRRVIKKLDAEDDGTLELTSGPKPDRGFRVYKLAESNFTTWDAQVATPAELAGQLTAHVDHLRAGRTGQDILAEIILKAGLPLTAPVETLDAAGVPVQRVDGTLLVSLSRELTLEAVRAMAALAPERVVCLDAGFQGNDQLKANAVQLFKAKNIVFRTA